MNLILLATLRLDGTDLRSERREQLAKLLRKAPENIKRSEELQGAREELLQVARRFELEGLMAKRPESIYESGRRSGACVKVKLTQQLEFVIGGYTPPERSRKYFGALLVRCRVGGGAPCGAGLRPPLKLDVQISRIQLSQR